MSKDASSTLKQIITQELGLGTERRPEWYLMNQKCGGDS